MADFLNNLKNASLLIDQTYKLNDEIVIAGKLLSSVVNKEGKIYIAGNGGSASDSNHFAGELVGRFYKERSAIPCVSLVSDITTITAISNDYGYDAIFERQLEAVFNPTTDIFIGISTSGNSVNLLRALAYISEVGGTAINLLGKYGGAMKDFDQFLSIIVPSNDTPRIQEMHIKILHYWAEFIEEAW